MGWENVFHCEINPFCQKILKYYWPDAKSYEDIKKTDFREWRGKVDVVSGGFPCQPYSLAGKRKGTEDDRHLWPQMLRAIREIQPRWVVGENVYGLINWSKGLVFEQVQIDLENEGYEITPYILPACAVNAPHRRDRIWFVGHAASDRRERKGSGIENENGQPGSAEGWELERRFKGLRNDGTTPNTNGRREKRLWNESSKSGELRQRGKDNEISKPLNVADPERIGQPGQGWPERQSNPKTDRNWKASWADSNGGWPTVSPIRGGNDGLSSKLAKQCLEALGNAVVPQVVYEIFKAIDLFDKNYNQ